MEQCTPDLHFMINFIRGGYKVLEEDWQKAAHEIGLTKAEQHMIWILHFERKATMSKIAEIGLWDVSTVMQMMYRLKNKGLVKTMKSEFDRRVSYVILTEQGEEKWALSLNYSYRLMNFFQQLSSETDETKRYIDDVIWVLRKVCEEFYGKTFVDWVDQTGQIFESESIHRFSTSQNDKCIRQ